MARTKATVRRLPVKTRRLPGWVVNKECGRKKTIYPFKTKETLPERKTVNINNENNKCQTKIEIF